MGGVGVGWFDADGDLADAIGGGAERGELGFEEGVHLLDGGGGTGGAELFDVDGEQAHAGGGH